MRRLYCTNGFFIQVFCIILDFLVSITGLEISRKWPEPSMIGKKFVHTFVVEKKWI